MINKQFPKVLGFSVQGTEKATSSRIQGTTATETSQFTASVKEDVCLQSDVSFDIYGDRGTVKLTDTDGTKNLVFHADSQTGSMSVLNPSRGGGIYYGEQIRVEVGAGQFQATPALEKSLLEDRYASVSMTSQGSESQRTEFSLEKIDGTQRKLILEGGVLSELDEGQV
jgi:hypothetical protein